VFVDRKYNRELAIKAATVCEMDDIRLKKDQIRRVLSCHQISPLAQLANRSTSELATNYSKQLNPVLKLVTGTALRKRRKVGG